MRKAIAADYAAMRGMIFGDPPGFDEMMETIEHIAAMPRQRDGSLTTGCRGLAASMAKPSATSTCRFTRPASPLCTS